MQLTNTLFAAASYHTLFCHFHRNPLFFDGFDIGDHLRKELDLQSLAGNASVASVARQENKGFDGNSHGSGGFGAYNRHDAPDLGDLRPPCANNTCTLFRDLPHDDTHIPSRAAMLSMTSVASYGQRGRPSSGTFVVEAPHTPGAPSRPLFTKKPYKILGFSESTWYRIPVHKRPAPVPLPGGGGKYWLISDLIAWAEGLAKASTRRKKKPAAPAPLPEPQLTAVGE